MSAPRNPFILRDAERIRYDETFLNLFGPGILDILSDDIINRPLVHPFTSSPGGGKTSLFRLFEPRLLLLLNERRDLEEYKELYNRLKMLNVFSDEGPNILGLFLSFNQNYDLLEDLDLTTGQKIRFFLSLLNSRIIIAGLRGLSELFELSYPEDLSRLKFVNPKPSSVHPQIKLPCNGQYLYDWATENEMSILQIIDSFVPQQESKIEGNDTLFSLNLFQPNGIYINNKLFDKKVLLLLDDLEKLSLDQRKRLEKVLTESRQPINIWTAKRMEALSSAELFSTGTKLGREYGETINLENFWRKRSLGKKKRFESWLREIADRRTRLAKDSQRMQFNTFEACLTHTSDRRSLEKKYSEAIEIISKRLREKLGKDKTFDLWIEKIENTRGGCKEKAVSWRALEILVERRYQRRLFNEPIPSEEVQLDAGIKSISEFLLSQEFHIPYYFGFSRLVQAASFNVEQFIHLAGDLFEEAISSVWLNRRYTLSAKRQEEILRRVAKEVWSTIPNTVSRSGEVISLLTAIRDICKKQTFRKAASYEGVTGIGVLETEINRMVNSGEKSIYSPLKEVLKICVSQNFLEEHAEYRQGKKGRILTVFYLNRLLCVHFGLPLNYGGWRKTRISSLLSFIKSPEKTLFQGGSI